MILLTRTGFSTISSFTDKFIYLCVSGKDTDKRSHWSDGYLVSDITRYTMELRWTIELALNKIPECHANSESSTARTTRKYLEDNYKGNWKGKLGKPASNDYKKRKCFIW